MAGIVGWSVILGVALVWEGVALRAPGDRWLTLSDILRYATRPPLGRWLLFALWLWMGWHLFVRGWDFFLQDPSPPGGASHDHGRGGGSPGTFTEAFMPLVFVYVLLLCLLGYCARERVRAGSAPGAVAHAPPGGWPALARHVAMLAGAGYVLFLAGLALFDAGWGRDPTVVRDAITGGAFLATVAAAVFVLLSLLARAARRGT
jgi:hypothetical protein